MLTIDEVKKQLKDAGVGRMQMWTAGRELFALANALGDQERIEAAVPGEYEDSKGFAIATQQRVLFVGGGIIKNHAESFLYDKIGSVQAENKRLVVYASGNSATLEKIVDPRGAQKFADYVRTKLAATKADVVPSAPPATVDLVDQLRRLAKLRDDGILTEDEFQAQKRKLLD